jgi:hypothetical protein
MQPKTVRTEVREIEDVVRDGEDFGGVRKESKFYSSEQCSHF